tara:strand:+ start:1098 stop:1703 length:606 start_codon:yes stop_codon:yes gene_type:complete
MRPVFIQFSLLFFSILYFSTSIYAESAADYVGKIHLDIVISIKENQSIYKENPEKFLEAISKPLEPLVDFNRISKNVMGKYYKISTQTQRDNFQKAFRASLLNTYSKTLAEFQDEEIIVFPETKKSSKSNKEKVYLEIVTSTKVYPAEYDMYLSNQGEWKLLNIIINGVNLGLAFRNQFYSLMKSENGDLDKVIEKWTSSI